MTDPFDFEAIRRVSIPEMPGWIRDHFPDGTTAQWWLAVFERIETRMSPLRNVTSRERLDDLTFAMEMIKLALEMERIRPAVAAEWIIKLSATTLRLASPVEGLPPLLSPDGAAEWAINSLPLSREQAQTAAEARRQDYSNLDDDSYAPAGVPTFQGAGEKNSHRDLQDLENVLCSLARIAPSILDQDVRQEVEKWLKIHDSF